MEIMSGSLSSAELKKARKPHKGKCRTQGCSFPEVLWVLELPNCQGCGALEME